MNCELKERDELINCNLGLVHACANRFRGKGIEYDDLFGWGCIGLVKAADNFEPMRGFAFSTYAVPVILGEIRRVFRDGGSVKVGRAMKEKARKLTQLKEQLENELDRESGVGELAAAAELSVSEAAELLNIAMPPLSLTFENEDGVMEFDIPAESETENLIERLALTRVMKNLPEFDRELIALRYFKGLTQSKTANVLGISQVQVSRKEKTILSKLRGELL
jgi:RNA polymerase sporulation-specific sigma factor